MEGVLKFILLFTYESVMIGYYHTILQNMLN